MGSPVDPDPPRREPAQVRVLGPVEVVGRNGMARLVGARQRTVLGLLALNAGVLVPQWRLVDGLWGEQPPRTAVKSLHSHVARVRQALDACGLPDALVTREPGYLLAVAPQQVDAGQFEAAVRRGREALAAGAADQAAGLLRRALALWRGEPALADAEPRGWAAAEVDRLSEARLAAAEHRWEAELRLGGHTAAADELERLLVAYPVRERLVGLLMLARYRSGRHTDALATYQRLRSRLADELGVDPGPGLVRLHAQILRRDPELDPESNREPDPETGRERAGWQPPGAGPPPVPRPAQLPAPVGHFTGRAGELAALDRLLADPLAAGPRIAVVSGLAGMGKTALAVQWAHRVADQFPDGQLFVDLRGHDPQTALPASAALSHLLRGVGVPADRIPAELAEATSLYRSLLHGRRLLVMLDNAGTAEAVLPLVPAGPANLLLVTSRSALAALTTHHAVTAVVLDAFTDGEAVALLGQVLGPQRVGREPGPAAELVRLCGRMPLALRIAAAKLVGRPGQSVRELVDVLAGADRLDALSVEADSRSVRAVFATAYRALRRPAARLFRLLGLHPGGTFTAGLAAALAGLPAPAAARALADLAAAHLVVGAGPDRYRFHDLIGLFARQCATLDEPEPERAEAAARLVDWYLASTYAANRIADPGRDRVTPVLRQPVAEPPFRPDHQAALRFLDGERGNLLPVVRFATEHGQYVAAWQLTYLLTGYHDSRGNGDERVEMCRWAITAAQRTGEPATEGLMRSALGLAYNATRRFDAALDSLHRALPLMRAAGDRRGEGHVLNNIATAHYGLRQFDQAVTAFEQALAAHVADQHRLGIALVLNNLGRACVELGDPVRSRAHLARALAISREIGNPRLEAATLHSLGETDLRGDDPTAALDHFGRALAVYREIGDQRYEVETLTGLGMARLRLGEHRAALAHLRQAVALCRAIADPHTEAVALNSIGRTLLDTGDPTGARAPLEAALDLRLRIPDAYEQGQIHRNLADLEQHGGRPAAADHHRRLAIGLFRKANATLEADQLAGGAAHPEAGHPGAGHPGHPGAGHPAGRPAPALSRVAEHRPGS